MNDFFFIVAVVILMLLFWGEPDLFDAMREYLIHYFKHASC